MPNLLSPLEPVVISATRGGYVDSRFSVNNKRRVPYSEPVYTGWSNVHWNATGWPSVHWDTTGPPSEYLQGTLEHHWKT